MAGPEERALRGMPPDTLGTASNSLKGSSDGDSERRNMDMRNGFVSLISGIHAGQNKSFTHLYIVQVPFFRCENHAARLFCSEDLRSRVELLGVSGGAAGHGLRLPPTAKKWAFSTNYGKVNIAI